MSVSGSDEGGDGRDTTGSPGVIWLQGDQLNTPEEQGLSVEEQLI